MHSRNLSFADAAPESSPELRGPSAWFLPTASFVVGFLLAATVYFGMKLELSTMSWTLLAPVAVAMMVFSVLIVLFTLEARKHFAFVARRMNTDFEAQLSETQHGFREAVDSIRKESVIVFEQDFNNAQMENRCYQRLIELVNDAKSSIFSIPNPYQKAATTNVELNMRDAYLRAIETKIHAMHKLGQQFEYTRIQQVPPGCSGQLQDFMGEKEWEHLERLEDMPYGSKRLMVIDKDEITGQIIIDGEIFINLITTVGESGRKRLVAIAIMKDPATDNIQNYYHLLKEGLLSMAVYTKDLRRGANTVKGSDSSATAP